MSNARHWSASSIEVKLEHFLSILNSALETSIPKKKCKRKFKYPPWWGENLTLMRSKLRKFAKIKTPEGRNSYTSLRREYKKAIKQQNMRGGKNSPLKLNVQVMNNSKNNAIGLLKKKDGDYSDNPEESLSILLNVLTC